VDGSASVAEHSPVATNQNSGHPAPLQRQPRVPNGIYPTMNDVQATRANAGMDRVLVEACAPKLRD
jgi:hypothetical protein